jgi:2-hydroxy-3-oxopropionate reductase
MMKIAYIGLGLMGGPCATHLQKAGHTLYIWGRSREKLTAYEDAGMIWCESPAKAAENAEILFTNLTDTPDVEAVLLGKNGVAEGAHPGLIAVDMSTISATATRNMAAKLKEKGVSLVDAPVSGGTQGAQNGTLTIMVGADEDVFEKVKPVLNCMGSKVTRIGDSGAGQVAKSCNQIVVTVTLMAVSEAFKMADSLGVDKARVREALLGGFAASKIMELHGQRMLSEDYAPGFKANLHFKDMNIVAKVAKELGISLPASSIGVDILEKTIESGHGELDSSAMYKIISKNN